MPAEPCPTCGGKGFRECGDSQLRGGPCERARGHAGPHKGFVEDAGVFLFCVWGDAVGVVRPGFEPVCPDCKNGKVAA